MPNAKIYPSCTVPCMITLPLNKSTTAFSSVHFMTIAGRTPFLLAILMVFCMSFSGL